jgi:outer membrane protein assembly factor BamA
MIRSLLMFGALVVATVAAAQEPLVKPRKFDAIAIPLLSFNSDFGVGVGAVGGSYVYSGEKTPYAHGIAAQGYATSRGFQNHWLRYDGPQLIGRSRLEGRIEYKRELLSPYYGPGNMSMRAADLDDTDQQLNYDRWSPSAWLRIRTPLDRIARPLSTYVGYAYRCTRVTLYPGSVLSADMPLGIEGGSTGQLSGGLLWDTRDDENDTTRGWLHEIALRHSSTPTASRYSFSGATVSSRVFTTLGTPRLVFAQRAALDQLFGDVPFFEWSSFGGINAVEGIGGMSSIRGVPRNRFVGVTKAVSNSELRFTAFQFPLLGEPLKVGGLALLDLGRTWHPGTDDGPWYRWHPGIGAGIRGTRRAAVIRIDYAMATETFRQGLYLTFGHLF